MSSKITIYGTINNEDSDLFESAGSLTLRTPRNVPNFNETTQLTVPGFVKQICAGQSHILALTQDGNVFSYGSNQFGQRGATGPGFQLVMKNVTQIAVGLYHSVVITKDNKIFVWGRGLEGQLGLGDSENVEKPTELKISGQEVCCGSFHTMIRNGETCYVMGENQNGQLGVLGHQNKPTKLGIPIESMAAGLDHSLFLYKGQVYVTGNNLFGQCGVSDQVVREPTKLQLNFEVQTIMASMGTFSGAISKQGKVYFWGTGSWGYARKCTPLEDLCKLEDGQKVTQVVSGENFAILKCQDGWYVFGMNKMPDNYSQQQTHRIQLAKVNIVDGMISSGLNIVFSCQHVQEVPKPIQQMAVDQGSFVSQSSDQDYKMRSSYKQTELRSSNQFTSVPSQFQQGSSAMKTSQIPPSALRQSQQVTNFSQLTNSSYVPQQQLQQQQQQQLQNQQYQQLDYFSNKIETKPVKEIKLNDLLYKSDHKQQQVDIRQELKLDLKSEQKYRVEQRTPDSRFEVKQQQQQQQQDRRSDYKQMTKDEETKNEIKNELKQELLKLEKKQEQFKYEMISQQQQFEKKSENLKEATFGIKSDVKPLQERNQQQNKCFDCQHLVQKNDYFQKHIRFQEEEILNMKKELEILKNQIRQKDTYIGELEVRILKYQESSIRQVSLPSQQPQIYKPTMEVRLKSEEKQPVREDIQVSYQKIIDYSPKIYRQPIIEQSPKERNFNTSIIDKIQTYQQSAKATRPVHQNLMNRYSAHEVQPQQIYQPNTYVIPQYFKARN